METFFPNKNIRKDFSWQKEIVFPNLDVISMFLYICGCNSILKPHNY